MPKMYEILKAQYPNANALVYKAWIGGQMFAASSFGNSTLTKAPAQVEAERNLIKSNMLVEFVNVNTSATVKLRVS